MLKSVSFNGYWSGDCECFCWDVNLDTFSTFVSHSEEEIKWKHGENLEQGLPKTDGIYGEKDWRLYPSHLANHLEIKPNKKYKITLTVEEINDV